MNSPYRVSFLLKQISAVSARDCVVVHVFCFLLLLDLALHHLTVYFSFECTYCSSGFQWKLVSIKKQS